MSQPKIGELLVSEGLITASQLETALTAQRIFGGRLGTNLVEHGFVSEVDLARVLSRQLGVTMVQPHELAHVDPAVIAMVPADIARKYSTVPFRHDSARDRLHLAVSDPGNLQKVDQIQFALGKRVDLAISPEVMLAFALERHYGVERSRRYIRMSGVTDAEMQIGTPEAASKAAPGGGACPTPASFASREEMLARIVNAPRKSDLIAGIADILGSLHAQCLFLAVRAGEMVGWESRGVNVATETLRATSLPLDGHSALHECLEALAPRITEDVGDPEVRRVLEKVLRFPMDGPLVLLPLIVNQKPFGLFVLAGAGAAGDTALAEELLKRVGYKLQVFFLTERLHAPL